MEVWCTEVTAWKLMKVVWYAHIDNSLEFLQKLFIVKTVLSSFPLKKLTLSESKVVDNLGNLL